MCVQYFLELNTVVITPEETRKIAALAKLTIEDNEMTDFTHSLGNILDMFDRLTEANTEKVDHLSIMPNIDITTLPSDNPPGAEDHTSEISTFSSFFDETNGEFLAPKVIDEG